MRAHRSVRRLPGAVVVGADHLGLPVVRSLGRRGIPVWVVRDGENTIASRSRFATGRARLEGATDLERVAFLLELASVHGLDGWTLFPTSNRTARLIAMHQDRLGARFTFTTPPWHTMRVAYDKRLLVALAARLGVDQPRTWVAESAADAARMPDRYPVCVKPAVSDIAIARGWRADSPHELRERFAHAMTLLDPGELLIQELVPGGGDMQFSYAALCDDGEPAAWVVARRNRQYPADFGRASTFVETVHDPEVRAIAEHLLRVLRYTGLVEVEFKRDPETRSPKLLDINPRVWGWHSLCQRAGVDFPYLARCLALGEPVPASNVQIGVRWSRLTTDLPSSLGEILAGRLGVGEYLRSWRGPRESAVFARDDPWPGVTEVPMLVGILPRRMLRSWRSPGGLAGSRDDHEWSNGTGCPTPVAGERVQGVDDV
jgi:D-aspartate ligase